LLARRLRLFDFEVFFLGTAISRSFLAKGSGDRELPRWAWARRV
jgi:hypothetical protein